MTAAEHPRQDLEQEIAEAVRRLPDSDKRKVLDFVRDIKATNSPSRIKVGGAGEHRNIKVPYEDFEAVRRGSWRIREAD